MSGVGGVPVLLEEAAEDFWARSPFGLGIGGDDNHIMCVWRIRELGDYFFDVGRRRNDKSRK